MAYPTAGARTTIATQESQTRLQRARCPTLGWRAQENPRESPGESAGVSPGRDPKKTQEEDPGEPRKRPQREPRKRPQREPKGNPGEAQKRTLEKLEGEPCRSPRDRPTEPKGEHWRAQERALESLGGGSECNGEPNAINTMMSLAMQIVDRCSDACPLNLGRFRRFAQVSSVSHLACASLFVFQMFRGLSCISCAVFASCWLKCLNRWPKCMESRTPDV